MFSHLLDSTGELAIMLINVHVFLVRPLELCPFVPRSAFSRPHKVNVGQEWQKWATWQRLVLSMLLLLHPWSKALTKTGINGSSKSAAFSWLALTLCRDAACSERTIFTTDFAQADSEACPAAVVSYVECRLSQRKEQRCHLSPEKASRQCAAPFKAGISHLETGTTTPFSEAFTPAVQPRHHRRILPNASTKISFALTHGITWLANGEFVLGFEIKRAISLQVRPRLRQIWDVNTKKKSQFVVTGTTQQGAAQSSTNCAHLKFSCSGHMHLSYDKFKDYTNTNRFPHWWAAVLLHTTS